MIVETATQTENIQNKKSKDTDKINIQYKYKNVNRIRDGDAQVDLYGEEEEYGGGLSHSLRAMEPKEKRLKTGVLEERARKEVLYYIILNIIL